MTEEAVAPEEVAHVASLARIDLPEGDVERFTAQFAEILEYFDALDDVPAVDGERDLANVMRPDTVEPSLTTEEALENAPQQAEDHFLGPNVS